MWYDIFTNPTFYLVFGVIAFFGYSMIKSTPLKKLPVFNDRKTLLIASIIGFLIFSGVFSSLGIADWGTGSLAGSLVVSDLQIVTTHQTDNGGTLAVNANVDDLLDCRFTDEQSNETTLIEEINGTGVIAVTRTGALPADSCTVRAIIPPKFQDESAPNGNYFSIVEEDSLGVPEVYIEASSSSTGASLNSPKETTTLAFAEGVARGYVSVMIEIDEEGHDALNQYSYKDVVLDVCGKPYTYRIHRMD
jgi:hypothetical protein